MTMVSELVLTRNQLLEIARREDDTAYKVPLQRLSHVTAELQEGVMKTRMQPIGNAWQKLPRVIRDLSSELGKKIELRHAGRRDGARPASPRGHQGSADAYGAQLGRPRHRVAGRPSRRRQARARHHPPQRLSRRRHDHDRDRRRRQGSRLRRHPPQGGRPRRRQRFRDRAHERCAGRQVHLPSRASRPRRPSRRCPAAASAWTWSRPISS